MTVASFASAVPVARPAVPTDSERVGRAALSRVAEPDDAEVRELLARRTAGEVWAALESGGGDLPRGPAHRLAGRARTARPERDLARLAALGGRLVCPGDAEWPEVLDQLAWPPYALWVRGAASLAEVARRAVAVVGSRAATAYGVHVAAELAGSLGDRGWATVSGGAYGVDGAAHRGSIAAGAPTVVVLACGLDVAYPSGHGALFARAAESGLVVSEWPPGCAPMRHRFLVRNRVIAALGRGTVVVEAALRSGARRTAGDALALGRPVMAVPGPVTSPMSAGCHALLREGATLVTGVADVLAELGPLDAAAPEPRGPDSARDALGPLAQRVLDATPRRRAVPVPRIAATCGLAPTEAARQLGRLAQLGLVVGGDGRYRLAPEAVP